MTYTNPGDTPDNIYQPGPNDPASGAHGIAEEDDTIAKAVGSTEGAVNAVFGRMRETAYATSAPVALGQAALTSNGTHLRCTTAGTTGTTEPAWPSTVGSTVTDGTAVWQVLAYYVPFQQRRTPPIRSLRTTSAQNTLVGAAIGGSPTSSITGAVAVNATNHVSGGVVTPNTFTYLGGFPSVAAGAFPNYYYSTCLQPTSAEGLKFGVEFDYYGTKLEYGYKGTGSVLTRVSVNDNYVEAPYQDSLSDGATHLRTITFPAAAWWRVRIESSGMLFSGVNIGPTDTVVPTRQPADRLLVIGDSYGEGTGSTMGGSTNYAQTLGQLLGFGDVWSYSQGGTGLIATNTSLNRPAYIGRESDWGPVAPAAVLIQCSINDEPYAASDLATALTDVIAAVRTECPYAASRGTIWVMGMPWHGEQSGTTGTTLAGIDSALAQAAAAANVPYIDLLNPVWLWTGTGWTGINRTVTDGVTTAASTTITSATANFAGGDAGRIITGGGIPAGTTIASVTNTTTAVLSVAATATATGVTFNLTNQRGNGNSDVLVYADGAHPTQAGHDMLARFVADGIINSVPAL